MNESIAVPEKTSLTQTEEGVYRVCLTDGICLEFPDLWEAEEHIRNLETSYLIQKNRNPSRSW